MGRPKTNVPSSVAHYTSLGVLFNILENALASEDGVIVFHLTRITMMNDAGEEILILGRYFGDSIFKKDLRSKWESFYQSNIPFVFSTIQSNSLSSRQGALPMWKIYGDDCKGAMIRFNWQGIKECVTENVIFEKCKYLTTTEIRSAISCFNHEHPQFKDLLRDACLTKSKCWEYEDEWRLVLFTTVEEVKFKITSRGIVQYVELTLPIEVINGIILGPLVDSTSLLSLESLISKIKTKFNSRANFNICKSNILIR